MHPDVPYESSVSVENISLSLFNSLHDDEESGFPNRVLLHTHAYIELFACVTGNLVLLVGDDNVCLSAGDICFIPMGLLHSRIESSGEWFALAVSIRRRAARNVQDLFTPLSSFYSTPHLFRGRADLCARLHGKADSQEGFLSCFAALSVLSVCADLCMEALPNKADLHGSASVQTDFDLSLISRLETKIESGYTENLRLEQVAADLFISPRQLSRIIKKRYGMSFHVLILQKRINTAKILLAQTDIRIPQIGKKVGFANKESFYRAFRQTVRLTPAAYRRAAKGKSKSM